MGDNWREAEEDEVGASTDAFLSTLPRLKGPTDAIMPDELSASEPQRMPNIQLHMQPGHQPPPPSEKHHGTHLIIGAAKAVCRMLGKHPRRRCKKRKDALVKGKSQCQRCGVAVCNTHVFSVRSKCADNKN
ncbi:hypothetical protein Bbelb_018690 [Branchiostoma belcheri]|nr:hypothetical protein Bbelb_018690 [Branchiostoma belcheri]